MNRCAAVLAGLLALPLCGQSATPPAVVQVGVTVADLRAAVRFYTEVLGFTLLDTAERAGSDEERLLGVFGLRTDSTRLKLGDEILELTEFLAPRGRRLPDDARSNDRSFQHIAIVVRDMDAAYAHLRRHRVAHASPAPQTLPPSNPTAGGIRAFYFRDPDGHALEVLHFPPDKGDPKWRRAGNDLFLGIDHTAIVVGDTERSLAFWRDTLGLSVAGTSDNHGAEQERLNNVFGARLRITTLRGTRGPGVELLEYLTPRTGRPMPDDTAANDLWHWVVTVRVPEVEPLATILLRAGQAVSPAPGLRRGAAGADPHFLARDPDGHRVMLSAAARQPR
ncbi:MAG: VOC family protein [Planctomycetes bacterium]|nr:VOC family protein [Planctomycetota bacterium]